MAEAPSRFVSIPEFCERTTLCRQTVYNMIDRGEIARPVKLTRNRVAFPVAVVDAWIEAKTGAV